MRSRLFWRNRGNVRRVLPWVRCGMTTTWLRRATLTTSLSLAVQTSPAYVSRWIVRMARPRCLGRKPCAEAVRTSLSSTLHRMVATLTTTVVPRIQSSCRLPPLLPERTLALPLTGMQTGAWQLMGLEASSMVTRSWARLPGQCAVRGSCTRTPWSLLSCRTWAW